MKTDEEMLLDLFEVVKNYIMADSGDGWGFIISRNYKELADKFEAYDKVKEGYFSYREDNEKDNFIIFHDSEEGQEGITFMDKIPEDYGKDYYEPILVVIR
jgi:hypothetical protein